MLIIMKKNIITLVFFGTFFSINAQFIGIDARLKRLEEKKTISKNLKNLDLNNKKFTLSKDFDDHTERMYITINENQATYVEVFYDKDTQETSSNVFTGDMKKAENVLSFRFDKLEGEKVGLPVAKNFIINTEKKKIYLLDVNTKERWIEDLTMKN